MSVLIKGITAEELLNVFQWARIGANNCMIGHGVVATELPDHGDLIDRNMLIGGFADWYLQESPMYLGDNKVVAETIGDAMKAIEAAPVVFPAERSEDERTY